MIFSKELIQGLQQPAFQTKLIGANNQTGKPQYVDVMLVRKDNNINFHFGYNKNLIQKIKTRFEDRKWLGPPINPNGPKIWQAPITFRNLFQLESLRGKYGHDPYLKWDERYDRQEIINYCNQRDIKPYEHQLEMISLTLGVHWTILAAEMGLGKTLAALVASHIYSFKQPINRALYVGPNSALVSAKLELLKWKIPIDFELYTYEGIKKAVADWEGQAPRVVIFDETALLKNGDAQRTKACKYVADCMRNEYAENCLIILLCGKPAPKTPLDWHSQAEIACPGFLSEATIWTFRERLGIYQMREGDTGTFPELVTWRDDEDKCYDCGKPKDSVEHRVHQFKPGVNEVEKLGKRLTGLAEVWFKKDCLDLPEKRYHTFELEPTKEMLDLAKVLAGTVARPADLLIKLRTLSDGFIYKEEPTGEFLDCSCENGKIRNYYFEDEHGTEIFLSDEEVSKGVRYIYAEQNENDEFFGIPDVIGEVKIEPLVRMIECPNCGGTGKYEKFNRKELRIKTPKDDLLRKLIDQHEEQGRLNVYGAFHGTIDNIINVFHTKGWTTLKADGRGWKLTTPNGEVINLKKEEMIYAYQEQQDKFPFMGFVGHAGSAGRGLTLTASPSTFFYSNDFNPDNRGQAEDRGHRIGMDVVRGGWIYDCTVLPSDLKVLKSLRKSKNLELMSLEAIKAYYL